MKIFYGIAGEGLGHATRSRPLLQYLLKHHSVRIFAGGKALHYLKSWFPVCKVESMRLKYSGNRMSALKTIIHNLSVAPLFFLSFLKVFLECLLHRPNVVITDFEPWCAWSALLLRIPLISIQLPGHYLPPQPFLRNKQSIASTGLKHRSLWCRLTLWFVTTITVPYADKVIIPSFFRVPVTDKRAVYVEPVVRDEIRKRKNTAGNHVIVYQTSGTYTKLIHVLKKFPEQNFIIYGFNKVSSENNLFFKNFNEDEFFDDLCSAKGVITNGGISLMTEAVFLGKPVLSIPIQGQGEQLVNAYFLEKTGNGFSAEFASDNVIGGFLKSIDNKKFLRKKNWSTERTCRIINELVLKLAKKRLIKRTQYSVL